jgi:hypothetical protein
LFPGSIGASAGPTPHHIGIRAGRRYRALSATESASGQGNGPRGQAPGRHLGCGDVEAFATHPAVVPASSSCHPGQASAKRARAGAHGRRRAPSPTIGPGSRSLVLTCPGLQSRCEASPERATHTLRCRPGTCCRDPLAPAQDECLARVCVRAGCKYRALSAAASAKGQGNGPREQACLRRSGASASRRQVPGRQ